MPAPLVYAIDFGTSNSLLGAAEPGQVHAPIALDPGAKDPTILRSILYFPSRDECHYGTRAIEEFAHRDMEGRLIRSVKRFLPMRSFVGTFVDNRPLNLEDIIAVFLGEMRRRANAHFGREVDAAVIGRPARFAADDADDSYAQYRLERAARAAGFKHVEFFPEPVAAAYGFRHLLKEPKNLLVGDFGGGTSDYTVMRMGGGASEVLAIGGVPVAGDAFDGALMRKRVSRHFGADVEYKVPFGANILKMPVGLMERLCTPAEISLLRKRDTMEFFRNVRQWSLGGEDREKMDRLFSLLENQLGFPLFEEIERTKRALSDEENARFRFTYPEIEVDLKVTRKQFEGNSESQVHAILESLDSTMKASGLRYQDIDIVCCTGGTARVPAISHGLSERFGEGKLRQHNHYHCVVEGLCERALEVAKS
jgi:hypothetical chaperone protein